MVGTRRKARAVALQILYEVDASGHGVDTVIERLLAGGGLGEENNAFIRSLIKGVIEKKTVIDQKIGSFAPSWPVEQLSIIDRNILRLAIYEILLDNKVPVKVAINEAVELAKIFGSDNSSKFINGVLSAVALSLASN